MMLFIDTSAFYAVLDRDDHNHQKALKIWNDVLSDENTIVTSSCVLVESFALIQHRLGLEAMRGFHEDVLPLISIEWVDETAHRSSVSALLATSRRKLSLVDCVSFEIMRTLGIRTVFAFDLHFSEQGFRCIP